MARQRRNRVPEPKQARITDAVEWLKRAKEDMSATAYILTATKPLVRASLFHAHQAVEKTMRAFLAWHGQSFRDTRDLCEIGRACAEVEPSIGAWLTDVAGLSPHGAHYLTGNGVYDPQLDQAKEALLVASSFVLSLSSQFPEEVVSSADMSELLL